MVIECPQEYGERRTIITGFTSIFATSPCTDPARRIEEDFRIGVFRNRRTYDFGPTCRYAAKERITAAPPSIFSSRTSRILPRVPSAPRRNHQPDRGALPLYRARLSFIRDFRFDGRRYRRALGPDELRTVPY